MRRDDLAGRRFGRWRVLRLERKGHHGRSPLWLCQCDCGAKKAVPTRSLRFGKSRSCGCLRRELTRARQTVDRAGQRYGRLTAIRPAGMVRTGRWHAATWLCRCECGKEITVRGNALQSRNTQSCGCLKSETSSAKRGRAVTHGNCINGEFSGAYRSWHAMQTRCRNLKDLHYGSKGIKVCEHWEKFENFLGDMGPRPEGHRMSIHRLDDAGNYEPGNCVWATSREQAKFKARILMSLKPQLLPEPSDGRHLVTLQSEYATMQQKFAKLANAQAQAEKWRADYPSAKVTIELAQAHLAGTVASRPMKNGGICGL